LFFVVFEVGVVGLVEVFEIVRVELVEFEGVFVFEVFFGEIIVVV
jgi:hypothetical protein